MTAQAFASHYAHKQYVDPDFSVPELSNESAALEERLMAWAARRNAEFENSLDALFEPPREPNETERRELDVVASRVSSRLWLRLAECYLEIGHLDDALAAAHRAYRLSHRSRQQARALAVMAEAVLAQDDVSLAVNLYG